MQTKHQEMEQDSLYRNIPPSFKFATIQDLSRKIAVGKFIESHRKAYENKDIAFFRKTYKDCFFSKMPKDEKYLENMEEIFKVNKAFHVTLDKIKILKHPTKEPFYGVTALVTCDMGIRQEKGYNFWLVQFEDDTHFLIHVMAWQPYDTTPKENLLTPGDFAIDY